MEVPGPPAVQTIMTHFGWLDLHARSVPARLSGGEERMGFRLLVQRFRCQVDAARPDDRPGLRINRDLSEVGGVIQWQSACASSSRPWKPGACARNEVALGATGP
jgi:hypothetical protein